MSLEYIVKIEIPKGSRNKYEYDPTLGAIKLDRVLYSSLHYPSDYGYFVDSLGEDGDPLDALVLVWEPTFPGCLIKVKPVGLFKMFDEKGQDDKVLCVPVSDPLWNHVATLKDVPPHLLKEFEHFFTVYKDLEQKKAGVQGWDDKAAAIAVIERAQLKFQQRK
jgi:inorganic pyrophosphatase